MTHSLSRDPLESVDLDTRRNVPVNYVRLRPGDQTPLCQVPRAHHPRSLQLRPQQTVSRRRQVARPLRQPPELRGREGLRERVAHEPAVRAARAYHEWRRGGRKGDGTGHYGAERYRAGGGEVER